jgi:type IV pilus assembly protein PilM
LFGTRKVLCLDWDRRSLRIVVARIGGGRMALEDAHLHRVPAEITADEPQAFGGFIARALSQHQIRHKHVIVDVPRDRAVINRLRLPPTPNDELPAAVRFQAMRELPFPLDEAQIDFVTIERDEQGRSTEVLLAAVRRETLELIRATCEAAGLKPTRIGLRPYANLVSVRQLPDMIDRTVLYLDVGPSMTEIDVIQGDTLVFSRAASVGVPLAGGELAGDDSRVSAKSELSTLELSHAVESQAVDELLVEVTRSLQAFRATEPEATIDQIVIAGGTGIESTLLDAMDERFGLPTTLFDPTRTLGIAEHEAGKLRAFSAALGLAWAVARNGLLELDFLNPKRPVERHASLKKRLRMAGLAAGIALAAGIGWAVRERIQLNQRLDILQDVNRKLAEELEAYYRFDNRILAARDWETESKLGVLLDHLLAVTQAAVPQGAKPGEKLLITGLNWRNSSSQLTLKVAADEIDTADQLVRTLNGLEHEGERLYRAQPGTWQELSTVDPRFKGSVDVTVEVIELARLQENERARERELERRVRTVARGG